MTDGKNILIVFPHNFLPRGNGVNKRYYGLARWLRRNGFTIDLLGLRHFDSSWDRFDRENADGLIRKLYLYDFRRGLLRQRVSGWFGTLTGKRQDMHRLPDYAFPGMSKLFRQILDKNHYDFLVIGYVYWANLIRQEIPAGMVKVLTVEDLISRKIHEHDPGSRWQEETVREEIDRVGLFDRVVCLSHEELAFFSAHATSPVYHYVPVFMDKPAIIPHTKSCDLMFIGFDNRDNVEGIGWFFREVFPLLPSGTTLTVVGRVSRHVPCLPGVTRLEHVADPGEVYARCRFAINPLQKGTGMKVKLVESLAHGVPVISTTRGLCGLPPELVARFEVADDPRMFAETIRRLLADAGGYEARCREASELFSRHFETAAVDRELTRLFRPAQTPHKPLP